MTTNQVRRAVFAAGLLIVLLFATACGGGEESVPSASDETSDATEEVDSQSSSPANEVVIKGIAFAPSQLEVEVGTKVTWVNEDDVDHTVTSGIQRKQGVPGVEKDKPAQPDGTFDENLPGRADTFGFTFDEPGTYAYFCDVHASMTGEVIVR